MRPAFPKQRAVRNDISTGARNDISTGGSRTAPTGNSEFSDFLAH